MKHFIHILLVPAIIATQFLLQCSSTNVSGGGTIETTNGIVGVIRNGDDSPSSHSIVRLFPKDFDPVSDETPDITYSDTTDAEGIYRFSNLEPGNYVVIARDRLNATGFLKTDITVTGSSVTSVPEGTLRTSGSITLDFSSDEVPEKNYVYIPGTDIASPIGTDGSAVLAHVPPGTFPAVIFSSGENDKRNILRNDITVNPGETTNVERPLWEYCTHILLNTTTSGADISGDVCDFPVLIRLDENNFNFFQASSDGSDLVFTGSENSDALPHEIELWDSDTRHAAIWVLIDTVRGNNDTQSIRMYWGNQTAETASQGTAVFDTTGSFQGIWHLGNDVSDATANGYHGMSPEDSTPQVTEGIIGNCRFFDGVDDYVSMPNTADSKLNFRADENYTISAWVKTDAFDNQPHLIVAKGYEQYFLRLTYFPVESPLWEFSEFSEDDTWQACTTTATDGKWILITGVKNGDRQLLYCNGTLVDSIPNSYSAEGKSRNTAFDLSIGKFLEIVNLPNDTEGYCFFKGSIDEVRIHDSACNPDWMRLCYMNQRADDRLTVFK